MWTYKDKILFDPVGQIDAKQDVIHNSTVSYFFFPSIISHSPSQSRLSGDYYWEHDFFVALPCSFLSDALYFDRLAAAS